MPKVPIRIPIAYQAGHVETEGNGGIVEIRELFDANISVVTRHETTPFPAGETNLMGLLYRGHLFLPVTAENATKKLRDGTASPDDISNFSTMIAKGGQRMNATIEDDWFLVPRSAQRGRRSWIPKQRTIAKSAGSYRWTQRTEAILQARHLLSSMIVVEDVVYWAVFEPAMIFMSPSPGEVIPHMQNELVHDWRDGAIVASLPVADAPAIVRAVGLDSAAVEAADYGAALFDGVENWRRPAFDAALARLLRSHVHAILPPAMKVSQRRSGHPDIAALGGSDEIDRLILAARKHFHFIEAAFGKRNYPVEIVDDVIALCAAISSFLGDDRFAFERHFVDMWWQEIERPIRDEPDAPVDDEDFDVIGLLDI